MMKFDHLAQPPKMQTGRRMSTQPTIKTVPFDYVVTLDIIGEPDRVVQNVINISTEGQFVATAISYSLLVDERQTPVEFGPVEPGEPEGFKTPKSPNATQVVQPDETISLKIFGEPGAEVLILVNGEVVLLSPPEPLILDENGRLFVPFDPLPIAKGDAVVIRDITNNLTSPAIQIELGITDYALVTPQFGPQKPFSGGSQFDIAGTPGIDVEILVYAGDVNEPPIFEAVQQIPDTDDPPNNIEAGLLKLILQDPNGNEILLNPGDTILIKNFVQGNNFTSVTQIAANVLDFNISSIPAKFLRQGFRLNPLLFRRLENEVPVPPEELETPFQPCGVFPEDLSFKYAIIDNGTGRELQSEPIHNLSGLGIANGDRPFRMFPKPIVFEPRSVILFQVQEILGGPGKLYFVLQGYKVLGTGSVRIEE
jgi:hypothetical protein